MKTTEKAASIADLKAIPLQMNKKLISIDSYAQKESLSIDIVEKCAQIGLLQIRKCKGQVFIVDTPFSAFGPRNEILAEINSQIHEQKRLAALKKQTPTQKPVNAVKPAPEVKPTQPANKPQPAKPVASVKKQVSPVIGNQPKTAGSYKSVAERIAEKQMPKDAVKPRHSSGTEDDEPIEIDEIINTEILSGKIPEIKPEDFGLDMSEIDEILKEKDQTTDYQRSYYDKSRIAAAPPKNWTTAAIISALCLSFSLMCCFWLYLDGQMQRDKISNLRIENAQLQKNISSANMQTAGIRDEFAASNRKISELNDQISNLRMELANTKNQLELTTQQLRLTTQNPQ